MVRVAREPTINHICIFIAVILLCANADCLREDIKSTGSPVPVVLWHGMGDSCCFSFSLGKIQQILQDEIPGIYVHSIRIGNNEIEDVENGYFGNINEQIKHVCEQMSQNTKLQNGYNAIGFSQGAQFLAVAQRCPNPPMLNLVSLGGQHQGVFGLPKCSDSSRLCNYMRRMLHLGAYLWYVQNSLIQASYWHDPLQENEYQRKNLFLAEINNENINNIEYKNNLQKLRALVLVKFENDTMVEPVETEWFGFYKPGQAEEVQKLQQSELYQKDWLGLRAMENAGKVYFISLPGDHLQFTADWFIENIIKKYLI
ncbi:PREDICTED: palmitoyl-protein thioesterase 1 isoform X2 [Trachymyrmex septentrionalis]|uniref:palmitoyl-protein thioesterase 1 isoform X2 n=1 Tax=Trachymyrmex septentrionalis TaxID=34720 RepID=UPI00084EE335|nr:PREDICTED: palmitoyl-protein thioesterase 1 isoform X2 [Trachymyrmex septentrionalis]